jgi:DNA invertase Pin-like site-specific DNA recombinase
VSPQCRESRAHRDQSGLTAALDYIRAGDSLVVWKLDRLGRSLPHLIQVVTTLREEVAFRSLTEWMDTTTAHGEMFFDLFSALASTTGCWRVSSPPGSAVASAAARA